MYMKKILLRYLSVISLGLLLFACEDDDKLTDDFPPEDGVNFSFKPLQFSEVTDLNGDTYISSGTLSVDADISSSAPEGFSKEVLIQIVRWEDGEETEITKGAPFNLSGNGSGDAKTFTLNFDDIVNNQFELNIGANLLEAGSMRKLKGEGILVNVETDDEDAQIAYKIKTITWDTAIDKNNDGFFAQRNVSFIVATEGDVESTLTGNVSLINDSDPEDTVSIFQPSEFLVKREGFSTEVLSFSVNDADTLVRSAYEIFMQFTEVADPDNIAFEQLYKAADFVRIGFEPAVYDDREYSIPNQPGFTWVNQDPQGFFDTLHVNFDVAANVDLEYVDLDNTGEEFGVEIPYVRLLYKDINDPDFTEFQRLGDTTLSADPFVPQTVGFYISELLPGGAATYDFEIHIMEPSSNYFNSTDDVPVAIYTKEEFPFLGGIKVDP